MLSAFPYLLSYQQISPVFIRLTLGAVLIFWSYRDLRGAKSAGIKKSLDLLGAVIGVLLVIGLWTQVAAFMTAAGMAVYCAQKIRARMFLTDGVNYALILLVLALSLMVTGPGWWAFDYPL